MGKGEKPGYQDFLPFSQCFQKPSSSRHFNIWTVRERVNSLPNDKILDWSKWKAFADNKINVTEKFTFILRRVENIAGKGVNAGYLHFLHFP